MNSSWFSAYNPSVELETESTGPDIDAEKNPALFNPLSWPAHDMNDGLDLPTFDMFVKCVVQGKRTHSSTVEVPEQIISAGKGKSFVALRRGMNVRKHADNVQFQGPSRVPYKALKPFIQELLVLHHPYLQWKQVVIGLVGFAWDIRHGDGDSEMMTIATPALDVELAPYGTLAEYLKTRPLQESILERSTLSSQILGGLTCLHECQIIHGDLKPENILICSSEDGNRTVAKLSDFGHSAAIADLDPSLKTLFGGTRPWNAPEWMEPRISTDFYKSDIYSVRLLIWASFSLNEDPFDIQGGNHFATLKHPPGDTDDQKRLRIEAFKLEDNVCETACENTFATIESFSISLQRRATTIFRRRDHEKALLVEALRTIFQSTLQLDPASRSLQACVEAFKFVQPSKIEDAASDEDTPAAFWPSMYLDARRVSPKGCQLTMLRGPVYSRVPGSAMVARLSVAISKHIFDNADLFSLERRRDAAWFLFRSRLENYGVEEDSQNLQLANEWLLKFASLSIATGAEPLCFSVPQFCERLDCGIPDDFPLEFCVRSGLKNHFEGDSYHLAATREKLQAFPGLFEDIWPAFKSQGLRKLLPVRDRQKDLATAEFTDGVRAFGLPLVARFHITASCGDIRAADILVRSHGIDYNGRDSLNQFSVLWTALKFSQSDFVLWLLDKGVKAGREDQGLPVLCLIPNFDTNQMATIFKALCKAGASVNDIWWFDSLGLYLNTMSFLLWCAVDLDAIKLFLDAKPDVVNCLATLQHACSLGRLDVVKTIEYYLSHSLNTPVTKSEWKACLRGLTSLTPYQKLYMPIKPDFSNTLQYILDRHDGELDPETLLGWLSAALMVGDYESLSLWLNQKGSKTFLHRSKPLEKDASYLIKSALEWAIVIDRRAMFDLLIRAEPHLKLEQAIENFPTLLHTIGQRDLVHGRWFCQTVLALGENVDVQASLSLRETTAFEIAVRYKNYDIADMLLAAGACVDAFSIDRVTPLGELINSHSSDAIKGIRFLLDYPGVKPSFVVDRDQSRTALQTAAGPDYDYDWQYLQNIDDHKAILDLILEYFNDKEHLNTRDKAGFTALHHASYRGCDWAVERLLKEGADPNLFSCTGLRPLDCARPTRGLGISLRTASPNFEVNTPASQARRAAARSRCASLLLSAGGRDISDALSDAGVKRFLLAAFGLINIAKEDRDVYEPWIGEYPLKFITRRTSKMRNGSTPRIKA